MTTDTTLHDRLLELAKHHEDVRDALGIPSDYYVDQFEIDLLKQAAAALIEGGCACECTGRDEPRQSLH